MENLLSQPLIQGCLLPLSPLLAHQVKPNSSQRIAPIQYSGSELEKKSLHNAQLTPLGRLEKVPLLSDSQKDNCGLSFELRGFIIIFIPSHTHTHMCVCVCVCVCACMHACVCICVCVYV